MKKGKLRLVVREIDLDEEIEKLDAEDRAIAEAHKDWPYLDYYPYNRNNKFTEEERKHADSTMAWEKHHILRDLRKIVISIKTQSNMAPGKDPKADKEKEFFFQCGYLAGVMNTMRWMFMGSAFLTRSKKGRKWAMRLEGHYKASVDAYYELMHGSRKENDE